MAALLLIALVVVEAVGLYGAYRDLRTGSSRLLHAESDLGTQPSGWTADNVAASQREIEAAQTEIARGRARLDADPVLSAGAFLPGVHDQVRAVRDLAGAAVETAAAAGDVGQVAALYATTTAGSGTPGSRVIAILSRSEPLLVDAQGRLDRSLATINRDRALRLLPPLQAALAQAAVDIARADTDLGVAHSLAATLPAALGATSVHRYLILLANPTELRPDGGFSGVVGTLSFDHGNPSAIDLVDQYTLNPRYRQKFAIPAALARYLRFYNNSLELGDAGWDPDFPTAAQLAEQMWQSATSQTVDGVLEIDPYAIAALLTVTGPVSVPGIGTFDSQNLLPQLNLLINVQNQAKATTVPPVAEAVLRAILSTPGADWSRTASILLDQGRQHHFQLYVHSSSLEQVVHQAGFDGAIQADTAADDYLMVVDANVSASKADAYVKKSVVVKVEKPAGGLTSHEVTASYQFPALQSDTDFKLVPKSSGNPDRLYRDYVRFYVPQEANLTGFRVEVDGRTTYSNSVAEFSIEHGKRVVGAYIEVPPGHSGDVTLTYDAPLDPAPGYRLLIQKQAGRPALPTTLEVSYPGGIAQRQTELDKDTVLEVGW